MKRVRTTMRLWWEATACTAALVLVASAGSAQEILHSYIPGVWEKANNGPGMDLVDDIDGDGLRELLLGDGTWSGKGKVLVLSGADATPIYSYEGFVGSGLGYAVAHLGDTTGDLVSDFSASSWAGVTTFVWSGQDGGEVCQQDSASASIARLGDLNGDGLEDFLVGKPMTEFGGGGSAQVILGGACPAVHYTVFAPPGTAWFGASSLGLDDVTGDGIPDFAVGAEGDPFVPNCLTGYVGVYSGADGSPVWDASGETSADEFGKTLAAPGDLNGDGVGDLVVGAPMADGKNDCKVGAYGRLYFYDGVTGALLDTLAFNGKYGFGWELVAVEDANGNGFGDVLTSFGKGGYKVLLLDGGTRDVIYSTPTPYGTENLFGFGLVGAGLWDDDEFPDFYVGSPSISGVPGTYPGHLDLYSGAPIGVETFGVACATLGGDTPRIGATGSPAIGLPYALHLSQVAPGLDALLALGTSSTSWGGISLPLSLGAIGLPGCELSVAPLAIQATTTTQVRPGEGAATLLLPIPNDAALIGTAAYAQWLVLHPAGSPTFGATTRGLELVFQPWGS
jgi:hypothetical protein